MGPYPSSWRYCLYPSSIPCVSFILVSFISTSLFSNSFYTDGDKMPHQGVVATLRTTHSSQLFFQLTKITNLLSQLFPFQSPHRHLPPPLPSPDPRHAHGSLKFRPWNLHWVKYKKLYNNPHTIIGTIVVGLMVLQPLWGVVHHLLYKPQLSSKNEMEEKSEVGSEDKAIENKSSRHESNATSSTLAKRDGKEKGKGKMMPEKWALFGLFHRWIGRVTITLAMINGGLGFMLAKEYKTVWSFAGQVAYSVLASIVWITWMSFIVVGLVARRREGKQMGGWNLQFGIYILVFPLLISTYDFQLLKNPHPKRGSEKFPTVAPERQ